MGNGVLRVYQEDWFPFQDLPTALEQFTAKTGIATELSWDTVGVGTIEHMFETMIGSFTDARPTYDVVCCDEIILQQMARQGGVLDLAPRMRADGIGLDHVTEATRQAVSLGDTVLGLPCVNVSSMLLCRRDLLDRYGLTTPSTWDDLLDTAQVLQTAVRRDEDREFYGFEMRGAAGGGHAVWTIGSFIGSHGVSWLDSDGRPSDYGDGHAAALDDYMRLIKAVCPPDQSQISFGEMRRDYAAGRVGMIMDVGMEYAHVLGRKDALADNSVVAMTPAGPAGRAPNLYSPPYAIPARSDMLDEAWALVKFLCSDERLRADGLQSNAVECASLPVLYGADFDGHFRADLMATVRSSRAVAKEERPFSDVGIAGCEVVGNAIHDLIVGSETIPSSLKRIQTGLTELVAEKETGR
ncbi:MAG: extracellular solute-binding protein [Alphaproteobacteria bacterium]|nr:extracellular solute-binding protein [Alphaproteobacteria bacterium]